MPRSPAPKCPYCGHKAHDTECRRLGKTECRRVDTASGPVILRGQWPCGCPGPRQEAIT